MAIFWGNLMLRTVDIHGEKRFTFLGLNKQVGTWPDAKGFTRVI